MVGVNTIQIDEDLRALLVGGGNWQGVQPRASHSTVLAPDSHLLIEDLIPKSITALLRMILLTRQWQAVGLDGIAGKPVEKIGNYRISLYEQALADVLWARIQPLLPSRRDMVAETPTDHDGHGAWRAVGVSPLFRFIRYTEGGQLVAHYDATYAESDQRRTLMSLVIYLTDNQRGATRFLRDPQAGRRMEDMDFQDWDRAGHDDEVILRCEPRNGSALLFDHRILHDGEPLEPGDPEKIIIRTDIMFEKIS